MIPTLKRTTRRFACLLALAALVLATASDARRTQPYTGDAYLALLASQHLDLQRVAEPIASEADGYLVTGPLDAVLTGPGEFTAPYRNVRVVCPDLDAFNRAVERFDKDGRTRSLQRFVEEPSDDLTGFRGALVTMRIHGEDRVLQLNTIQQTRWLIWLAAVAELRSPRFAVSEEFAAYREAVSDYLYGIDRGQNDEAPSAVQFDLAPALDLYAPPPGYVIEGYEAYKQYLHDHEVLKVDFARGITGFVPGDSLLTAFKEALTMMAFPNKEAPMLQHEYRKFFQRGGDVRVIHTLTPDLLASLRPGEYFFAVGLSGKIRLGYETPREEVDRIENETGKKLARANHAFLFPGEPVLTAGALWVAGEGGDRRITKVNAHSGHYFYSNVTETVREDIAMRSNEYLLTLSHFFVALDEAGIPCHDILISKL